MKRQLVIIAYCIRSAHNVGSILRTAEGLGIKHVYLAGYTPYPLAKNDARLPHIAQKVDRRVTKASLGSEKSVSWSYCAEAESLIKELKSQGYTIAAIEQARDSVNLTEFSPPAKIAILLGSEIGGIPSPLLKEADTKLEIPMFGKKDSYNVSVAAAIAMYHLRFWQN